MKFPTSVNVLLLGNGGRECAFAWKIAQSSRLGKLYIAPGNGGTKAYGTNVDISPLDFPLVAQFVQTNHINLVVVGSEDPLVRGIRDFFLDNDQIRHVPIIGPSRAAAALEGSKDFAKAFMARHAIPTAQYKTISKDNISEGYAFLETLRSPYVLKADGLAAGKGVLIIDTLDQAKAELSSMITEKRFGTASTQVVIEEFLDGIEMSVFVVTDGQSYKLLPQAKDYKRIGEGDTGPNTGGMGAISPVPFATAEFMQKVTDLIIEPTVKGISAENLDYKGFIFIGLIKCGDDPYVIEYNVRMGDPETEAVLPRIESDIVDLFEGIAHGTLDEKQVVISPKTATTIVVTAEGYPNDYKKGIPVTGLDKIRDNAETVVFHSGTVAAKNEIQTNGGRVFAVTSLGKNIAEALAKAYSAVDLIKFDGKYCRKDIGQDLISIQKLK